MDEDVLPPSDVEAEGKLLGCLLVNPEHFSVASEMLEPADFYNGVHALLFRCMCEFVSFDVGELNLHNLGSYLKDTAWSIRDGMDYKNDFEFLGGWSGLANYFEGVGEMQPSNIPYFSKRLRAKRIKRDAIKGQNKIRDYAANGKGPEEEIEAIQDLNLSLTQLLPAGKESTPSEICESTLRDIIARAGGKPRGLYSGLEDLDRLLYGFAPGNVIILGGRPGHFKTQTAINLAVPKKGQQKRTLFVSLEMTANEIIERMFSILTGISGEQLKMGHVGPPEIEVLQEASRQIAAMDIVLLDESEKMKLAASVDSKLVQMEHEGRKPDQVIIDYLQLMEGKRYKQSDNRRYEVTENSRAIKAMAKKHGLPVILLSGVGRSCEGRADKRPMLSDLRESGDIEADADVVMFTYYHPKYYPDSKVTDCLELIVAKHRHGKTGHLYLHLNELTGVLSDRNDSSYKPEYGTNHLEVEPSRKSKRKGSTPAANNTKEEDKENA